MRLTLRTMLAYLDGILDEDQAKQLGARIEESDFASGLVHRIRSVTRRLRLGVPTLEGRGMGLDPNTVSEYLENVLPPERVPEIEKICLESDVHLAEVASCHQILILIESEPAEVDPDLKDRAYRLGAPNTTRRAPRPAGGAGRTVAAQPQLAAPPIADAGPAPPPTSDPLAPAPAVATARTAARKRRDVPDYLRIGQNSRWKPLAITLVLAFVVSAVALRAMGPFDASHPLLRLVGVSDGARQVAGGPTVQTSPDLGAAAPDEAPAGDASKSEPKVEPEVDDVSAEESAVPSSAAADDADAVRPAEPDASEASADAVLPRPEASQEGLPQGTPGTTTADEPTEAPTGSDDAAFPPTAPIVGSEAEDDAAMSADAPNTPETEAPVAEAAAPIVEVGYVKLTEREFLVRFNAPSGEWFRLPARTMISSKDQLVVLPTYRPEIVLKPGVQVAFVGAASVQALPPGPQGAPALAIDYGRLLIATAGVEGARIRLDFGGRTGTATFADAASEMGVEVRRFLPPGADPEVEPALAMVRIYTTIGSVDWQPDGVDTAVPIPSGHARVIIAGQAQTVALNQAPSWIYGETTDSLDRLAKESLETSVAPDRPVVLSLEEQSEGRRLEVRSLAARALAYLEVYEALIREFSDERQKALWDKDFDVLRRSVGRSPESAAAVREALERFCGDDATDLYRLIWGYSPEQLQAGADSKLVEFLEHPALSVRVFALENLRRITGKTLQYRPELTEDRRKSSVQEWRDRLASGAIVYETPPTAATMDGS